MPIPTMSPAVVFGLALRDAMSAAGFRQVDVAKRSGYSKGQISHWLVGRHLPSEQALTDLMQAMRLSQQAADNLRNAFDVALVARGPIRRGPKAGARKPPGGSGIDRSLDSMVHAARLLRLQLEAAAGRLDTLDRQIQALCAAGGAP
jgi:hypothetical protein